MPQPPTHCTTNSADTTNIISTASASPRKAHDTLSITDAKSPQQAVLMCSLSARRQERREMLESHYPPTHSNTHMLFRVSLSHSSFSLHGCYQHIQQMMHIYVHILTSWGYFFLICTLFPLKCHLFCGCCKSGLSSVSVVWGSIISPFPPPSDSTSPVGDTHLLYGILLSLLLSVTMAAAIKRFSSHRHYLISPPHAQRKNPYWFSFLICFECRERN